MNKIKYNHLLEIIKEELDLYFSEINESNPYKNDKGHFTSEKDAKIYSFTKRAPVSDELKKRGTYKNKVVSSKYGMNGGSAEKQCGRLKFSGEKKPKTRSCKNYPKRYGVKEDNNQDLDTSIVESDDAYIKSLVKKEIEAELRKYMKYIQANRKCRPTIDDFIAFNAKLTAAQNPPKK